MNLEPYVSDAVALLQKLISTPRVSRAETQAADIMQQAMESYGYTPHRVGNNLWIEAPTTNKGAFTIILNAHIDTVKPVSTWTRGPFTPTIEGDRLYGLGSNDCGGGLVSLLQVFRILTSPSALNGLFTPSSLPHLSGESTPHREGVEMSNALPYNLIYLASCEEEVSGTGGIRSVLPLEPFASLTQASNTVLTPSPVASLTEANTTIHTPSPSSGGRVGVGGSWGSWGSWGSCLALVGEPTGMQPAIAERGLMVIDGTAHGKSGHAARNEGINAIYEALDDLCFIRDYQFQKTSPLLGPTKMQCTVVNAGTQHNVVPDECKFIIDVRTNEHYTNEDVFAFLQTKLKSDLKARSFHLHSSSISEDHPLIQRCKAMGMKPFGSPTLSDQALMRFPSFKLGPGQSSRSHSADEFICISEIRDAIEKYLQLLS